MSIEITEEWRVVDRWWTDAPIARTYVSLRTDDVEEDVRVCVCYDEGAKTWSLINEPETSNQEHPPASRQED